MIRLGFLRHGVTIWNEAGRIQGRADISLSEAGRAALAGRKLPAGFAGAPVFCSPLARALETAALLGLSSPVIEPRLIEMDWGGYEGRTLAALRAEGGAALAANEARGLDFQPPGGESPRQVQARLRGWLTELAEDAAVRRAGAAVAITHKGVIRAALALAHDWDMMGKAPVKADWRALQVMRLEAGGHLLPDSVNLPLEDF